MTLQEMSHDYAASADADPHKEVVTYAVRHIDRLEK